MLSAESSKQVKVLVVDDNPINIKAMESTLGGLACQLISATSGREALELCLEHEFCCLLIDVEMPDMDGLELADLFRRAHGGSNTPIVFISAAYQGAESIIQAYEAGAVDYLLKPINPYVLQAKVTIFVKLFEQQRQLKVLLAKLDQLAFYDSLTNIYNRRQFNAMLEKTCASSLRYQRQFALLLLDIDGFKQVNDTLGHEVGDCLLKAFAKRLEQNTRKSDFVARMGGDEFAIVMPEIQHTKDPGKLAKNLIKALSKPYAIGRHKVVASASIGIVCYPAASKKIDALLKNADVALYKAKAKGKNTFQYFTQELNDEYDRRAAIELALVDAVANKEFCLHYQPRVSLVTEEVIGCEVLVRWNSPQLGNIPPNVFIPIAEENNLIEEIGLWIIDAACQQLMLWRKEQLVKKDFGLAINVSPYQLKNQQFPDKAMALVKKSKVPLGLIEFELTESAFLGRSEQLEKSLLQLCDLGILFSIDDFGTGYSSLSRLSDLPIKILKIDKSFVFEVSTNKTYAGIVKAIMALASTLDLEVVAEGVETKEQADFLVGQGCLYAQGYYFHKPLGLAAMNQVLEMDKEKYN